MQDTPSLNPGTPHRLFEQPTMCAECGLQIGTDQVADTCELCGAPRCRACANEAGEQAGGSLSGAYICSACAAEV